MMSKVGVAYFTDATLGRRIVTSIKNVAVSQSSDFSSMFAATSFECLLPIVEIARSGSVEVVMVRVS